MLSLSMVFNNPAILEVFLVNDTHILILNLRLVEPSVSLPFWPCVDFRTKSLFHLLFFVLYFC